jgi:hypothetical protein
MENNESWTLTLVFRDPIGKKEVTEYLVFGSKDAGESAMSAFKDGETRTGKIFTIQNEQGESVNFRGSDWIRYTIRRDSDFGGIH